MNNTALDRAVEWLEDATEDDERDTAGLALARDPQGLARPENHAGWLKSHGRPVQRVAAQPGEGHRGPLREGAARQRAGLPLEPEARRGLESLPDSIGILH